MAGDNPARVEHPPGSELSRRAATRIAAVQALYQIEMTGLPAADVVGQFLAGEPPRPELGDEDFAVLPDPDPELFRSIVDGVVTERTRLDEAIAAALSPDWTVARLEILIRLILEAGAFEIVAREDIPPRVSINEYVNVCKAFFEGPEPALVNGVLDAIAKAQGELHGPQGNP